MKQFLLAGGAAIALSACAKHTHELGTAYVSPLVYQDHTCRHLSGEMARLTRRAQELTYSVNKNAQGDSVAMGVGMILFWPSLFFIDGDNPDAQEYSRIRGEYDAAEQAAIQKDCAVPDKNPFDEAEKAYQAAQEKARESHCPPSRKGRC